jgi:hypothetical protein
MRRLPIGPWLCRLLIAIGCWELAVAPSLWAQNAPAVADTAAARRIVDSLIRTGAWRLPTADTVRRPTDTVRAAGLNRDEGLHAIAFIAGAFALAGLAVATFRFGWRAVTALDHGSPIGVRTHWGDFGAGNSGWEASHALALVVVTVVLASLTAAVATALLSTAQISEGERAAQGKAAPSGAAAPGIKK